MPVPAEENAPLPGFSRAIKSSITDLQETQASFLVTIASAAIATFHGKEGTGLANILTVSSWIANDTILKGIVTAGSYPLLLIQLVFHAGGTRGWYTLLFIIINGILVYVMHMQKSMDPGSLLPHFQDAAADLTSCGKQAGPRTFCREAMADNATRPSNKTQNALFEINSGVPHPVYAISAILLMDWAAHTIYYRRHSIRDMITLFTPVRRAVSGFNYTANVVWGFLDRRGAFETSIKYSESIMKDAYRGFWAFLELGTFAMCVLAIVEAKRFLDFLTKDSDGVLNITKWPFGQLIAVAVWFPIILKFLSLLVRKLFYYQVKLFNKQAPH